jgi:hypothetical protein
MVVAPDNFDNLVKKTNLEINRNKENLIKNSIDCIVL